MAHCYPRSSLCLLISRISRHLPVPFEAAAALAVVAISLLVVDAGGVRMAVLQYRAVGARVRYAHTATCRVPREAGALVAADGGAVRAERVLAAVLVTAALRQNGWLWNGYQLLTSSVCQPMTDEGLVQYNFPPNETQSRPRAAAQCRQSSAF